MKAYLYSPKLFPAILSLWGFRRHLNFRTGLPHTKHLIIYMWPLPTLTGKSKQCLSWPALRRLENALIPFWFNSVQRESSIRHEPLTLIVCPCSVSMSQVVHNCQLVRGRPFYGYHSEERIFVKIILWVGGRKRVGAFLSEYVSEWDRGPVVL